MGDSRGNGGDGRRVRISVTCFSENIFYEISHIWPQCEVKQGWSKKNVPQTSSCLWQTTCLLLPDKSHMVSFASGVGTLPVSIRLFFRFFYVVIGMFLKVMFESSLLFKDEHLTPNIDKVMLVWILRRWAQKNDKNWTYWFRHVSFLIHSLGNWFKLFKSQFWISPASWKLW